MVTAHWTWKRGAFSVTGAFTSSEKFFCRAFFRCRLCIYLFPSRGKKTKKLREASVPCFSDKENAPPERMSPHRVRATIFPADSAWGSPRSAGRDGAPGCPALLPRIWSRKAWRRACRSGFSWPCCWCGREPGRRPPAQANRGWVNAPPGLCKGKCTGIQDSGCVYFFNWHRMLKTNHLYLAFLTNRNFKCILLGH